MSDSKRAMLEILRQGPRLKREAAGRTTNVNEAYLLVHDAMAQAMVQTVAQAPGDAQITPTLKKRTVGSLGLCFR